MIAGARTYRPAARTDGGGKPTAIHVVGGTSGVLYSVRHDVYNPTIACKNRPYACEKPQLKRPMVFTP
jgi:hypothetical protein